MAMKRVIKGVHVVPMGMSNAFLIESDDGLTRIDAGYPGKQAAVLAVRPINCSTQFSLTAILIISGAPQRS